MKTLGGRKSTYIACILMAASAVMAQPSFASIFEHIFIIPPIIIALIITCHYEAYIDARDEFAPGRIIQGHPLYIFVEWMGGVTFGVRRLWIVGVPVAVAMLYFRFK